MEFVYQNQRLKLLRMNLRNNSTRAEKILWKHLRNKQLGGHRFQRQYSVNNFILDFYCPKAKLGIEIDGGHHAEDNSFEKDVIRTKVIESNGIKVIRFWNIDVYNRINDVLETIYINLNPE